MSEKKPSGDISKMLLEAKDAVQHNKAKEALKRAKQNEAKIQDLVSVRIDKFTTLLMSRKKAIKKGYINE